MALFAGPHPLIGPGGRNWAPIILPAQWGLCGLGIVVEALYHEQRRVPGVTWVRHLSLSLYVLMGWMVGTPPLWRDFGTALESVPNGMNLVLYGGLSYTFGIPFFVRNKQWTHTVWHLFTMSGSACYWLALLRIVQPGTWLPAVAAAGGGVAGAAVPL